MVDSGLCQLYTLYEEGGEPQAMLCGSKKEWEKPSGVAVDVDGTLLVADSPTSRLVKISTDLLFTGEVKIQDVHFLTRRLLPSTTKLGSLLFTIMELKRLSSSN